MRMVINAGVLSSVAEGVESLLREEAEIKFKEDKWMVMSKGPENVTMFAARVPETAMKEYDPGDVDSLGIKTSKILDFISSKDRNIILSWDYDNHNFVMEDEDYRATASGVNPEYVEGVMGSSIKTDWPIKVTGDIDFLIDFIKKADSFLSDDSIDAFIVGAREDGLYLYANDDLNDIHAHRSWDDFDGVDNDWTIDLESTDSPKELDAIYSLSFMKQFTSSMPTQMEADFSINMGEDKPIRVLANAPGGIDFSYVVTPRLSSETSSEVDSVPDDVVKSFQ